jgi:hypothetical protein
VGSRLRWCLEGWWSRGAVLLVSSARCAPGWSRNRRACETAGGAVPLAPGGFFQGGDGPRHGTPPGPVAARLPRAPSRCGKRCGPAVQPWVGHWLHAPCRAQPAVLAASPLPPVFPIAVAKASPYPRRRLAETIRNHSRRRRAVRCHDLLCRFLWAAPRYLLDARNPAMPDRQRVAHHAEPQHPPPSELRKPADSPGTVLADGAAEHPPRVRWDPKIRSNSTLDVLPCRKAPPPPQHALAAHGNELPRSLLAVDTGTTRGGNGGASEMLCCRRAFLFLTSVDATPPRNGCWLRGPLVACLGGGGGLKRSRRCCGSVAGTTVIPRATTRIRKRTVA